MFAKLKTLAAAAALSLVCASAAHAQDVAVTNARIITMGPQGTVERGTIVIRGGRVTAVGADVRAPDGVQVIDAQGGTVTPGIVAVDSALGGLELSSEVSTNDVLQSSNTLSAAFDVSWGLDPDSVAIPVARLGGITRAIVMPQHAGAAALAHEHDTAGAGAGGFHTPGMFAGQAAAIHLGEGMDIIVQPRVAMVAPFGAAGANIAGGARGAQFVLFKAIMDEVRLYQRNRAAYDRGGVRQLMLSTADLEALIPVAEGRMPLVVEVNRASDILAVLRLAREENLRIILNGAQEGWRVADEIAAARVPVILNPLADLPGSFETRGATLENAARLHAAGVTLAFRDSEGGNYRVRETRIHAGNAVANGLPYQAALEAITVNPARMFGLDSRFGSLQQGRDGDLVIWNGDPLEPLTWATQVVIRGVPQPMDARNLQLARRYAQGGVYPPAYRN
ncbi:amidohydrolase family protein [Brevundimonas sp. 2R-24]|uniref:Amidohydrolase family protein n=1 Tax=Peiella sedimenti TaxID=3061083 RepID=A0ABT8SMM0_9CAUL|nr:amidohydrolase family protein [Caulobacteraceae bacterium XZ-24]